MCGVSGILHKNLASGDGLSSVGDQLIRMLEPLTHRGRDSSGVTIVGERPDGDMIVRIWTESARDAEDVLARAEETVRRAGGVVRSSHRTEQFLRLVVNFEGDTSELAADLLETPGVALHSIGRTSEVIKDVGTPVAMDQRHSIGGIRGTHGIGHVRMATESRVDVNHAHPFWAYPFPDVSVVHNGQLTNYHKLRRMYEDQGHHFQTGNDSELIAVYLADKLSRGDGLNDALGASLEDLDGTFTYLVATRDGLGYAKDQWSAKPLVTMETEDVIVIASEEIALRGIFDQEIDRVEPQKSEVMTWLL
jgi:glutamate synthase domain-containing protein 1